MKKILIPLLLFLFTLPAYGQSWSKVDSLSSHGYSIYTTTLTIPDSEGANVVTVYTDDLLGDISDSRVIYSLTVTEASGANGDLAISAQVSNEDHQGSGGTSLTVANGSATRSTAAVATTHGNISLLDYYHGKWRFRLQTDGTDILDSATVIVRYAVPDRPRSLR